MYQESFVISMTKEKKDGFYVELGSGDPYIESNTLLLESEFGWKGLALEIEKSVAEKYNSSNRKNKCINADALEFDYKTYFEENNFPKNIDFLQIDIDGHEHGNCLLALRRLPMLEYRFSVIIIEHDLGRNKKTKIELLAMRNAQRAILSSLGYKLIGQPPSEDWWVDPKQIDDDAYKDDIFVGHPLQKIKNR